MNDTQYDEDVKRLEEEFLIDEKYLQDIANETENRRKLNESLNARSQVAIRGHQIRKKPAVYAKIASKVEKVVEYITEQEIPDYCENKKEFNSFMFSLETAINLAEKTYGKLVEEVPSQKGGQHGINIQLAFLASQPLVAVEGNISQHNHDPIPLEVEVQSNASSEASPS